MNEVLKTDALRPISALEKLHAIREFEDLVPVLVQQAINELIPGTPSSYSDAIDIYSFASTGLMRSPDDEEWASVTERAITILRREAGQQG